MVEHPNIKTTTSIIDFIFRSLAYEYLGRTDLVHVLDKPEVENLGDQPWDESTPPSEKGNMNSAKYGFWAITEVPNQRNRPHRMASTKKVASSLDAVNAANKSMQGDAPACNTCGHITVRSGTCYKCPELR